MGAAASLNLVVGDSLVNPGNPSIISDPIEHDFDAYCDEMVAVLKYPVLPDWEPALKSCTVTEGATPDEFEVKVIMDPVKLQTFGLANPKDPSLEKIAVHTKNSLDRKGRCITSVNYEPYWAGEEPKVSVTATANFTKDPFRSDYFWTKPDGTRQADETTLQHVKPVINVIMAALADRKVTLTFDEAKRCVASGPFEEGLTTYDALFDALIAGAKETPQAKIEEMSETKFKISAAEKAEERPYSICTYEKEQGTMTWDTFSADGTKKTLSTTWTVTKFPLSIEIRMESDGENRTNKSSARVMQPLVDAVIAKATKSGWGLGLF